MITCKMNWFKACRENHRTRHTCIGSKIQLMEVPNYLWVYLPKQKKGGGAASRAGAAGKSNNTAGGRIERCAQEGEPASILQ
jgi:hypothetical protein